MMKQLAFFLALASSASAIQLTPENWEAETTGKVVFIKFFAPWCGHCKAMAADWEQLMKDFEGSTTQLVAEVDCTADGIGDALCQPNGVQGFPTLKWGDPSDLQDYQGTRDYDGLKAFADANLTPVCSVNNVDLCDGEKKELIEKYLNMSEEELEELVKAEEKKIEDLQAAFEADLEKLQETFEELQSVMDNTMKEVKQKGLSMMQSILKSKEAPEVKEEL